MFLALLTPVSDASLPECQPSGGNLTVSDGESCFLNATGISSFESLMIEGKLFVGGGSKAIPTKSAILSGTIETTGKATESYQSPPFCQVTLSLLTYRY